jgi:arylsulfatase
LKTLGDLGIERNTLVVFMNDNGGTIGTRLFNAGMRGSKVTPWLGGTRAASFWRWPGTLPPATVDRLAAHIDVFPTLAEIAGAKLSEDVRKQVEGQSLVPLLVNNNAEWPDRKLFTHVGRWQKGEDPNLSQYTNCSIRTKQWHLVSVAKKGEKKWQLFDVSKDPGEQHDLVAQHPEVLRALEAAYDNWWKSVQPQLVNENAVGPKENPFKELYVKQFGSAAKASQ